MRPASHMIRSFCLTLGLLLLFFNWVKERKDRLAERLAEGEAL